MTSVGMMEGPNDNAPVEIDRGVADAEGESDDDLLSHEKDRTIIGAGAFHGPVRDGKGWFHSAMVVRHWGDGSSQKRGCSLKGGRNEFPGRRGASPRVKHLGYRLQAHVVHETDCVHTHKCVVIGSSLTGN